LADEAATVVGQTEHLGTVCVGDNPVMIIVQMHTMRRLCRCRSTDRDRVWRLSNVRVLTGETRWTADVRTGVHPEPCPWLTVAATRERLYCGNHYGVIDERDLTSGARTGATFDPQLGSVGDLAIAADGRELVDFGNETPAVSR
jgi:hypothetical protein